MELLEGLMLLISGLVSGVLAGFFGIGGGTFIVPAMIAIGMDIKTAIGISVMQMVFSSLSGSYINYKNGKLNIKQGLWVGLGGFIGAGFSGIIVTYLSSITLSLLFLSLVILALYRFLFQGQDKQGQYPNNANRMILVLIGIVTGIFAISLGIGGGLILVPLLSLYLGFSSKQTIPISLFFIIFSSLSGFCSLAYYGHVDYLRGSIVGIASIIGVSLGIWFLKIIDSKKHRYAIIILYIIIIAFMINDIYHDFFNIIL